MPRSTEDPYLAGNYAPVPDETSITDLPVEGEIPPALHGQYLQIGPNPIGNPARPYVWSEADGMVHAITIHAERAPSYRNRWVVTARASRLLGTEPVPGDATGATDIANSTIVAVGGRILALGEHAAYELSPDLETLQRVHGPQAQRLVDVGTRQPTSRFVYAIRRTGDLPYDGTEIFKHDLTTSAIERRDFGVGRHPGELVFVTDSSRQSLDDGGWLVGLVHDENTALAELVVLDAHDINAHAIATVHITRRVPYGLHCAWAPSASTPKERS